MRTEKPGAPKRKALRAVGEPAGTGGGFRGFIEVTLGQDIAGWAARTSGPSGGLAVGLFGGGEVLAMTIAGTFHPGACEAGAGDGMCGFVFPTTLALQDAAAKNGGLVSVRIMNDGGHCLGQVRLLGATGIWVDAGGLWIQDCRKLLQGEIETLWRLSKRLDETPSAGVSPPLAVHGPLFSTRQIIPGDEVPEGRRLPAYLDFTRHRLRASSKFDVAGHPDNADHFLDFYFKAYAANRPELRVPLSKAIIDRLNEPIVMAGRPFSLSRYVWWALQDNPEMLSQMRLDDAESIAALCYWWAWQEAKARQVEDCLVPPNMVHVLRSVSPGRRLEACPLTCFMELLHQHNQNYEFLDQTGAPGRVLYALSLMVSAVRRPDILRYLPTQTVALLVEAPAGGGNALGQFLRLVGPASIPEMTRERYRGILRLQGYDLDSNRFTSITAQGDRLHAAMLPAVTGSGKVDMQLVGPFKKASGLGQATRLSADILKATGLTLNCVDFGMDNPAPEGFSSHVNLGSYTPARINLFHLNAESIPLVYTYAPDVMSQSYNIGYFFWELETPARAHYLGLELLDEIWVSTAFGVSIYQPHTRKPVVNVGMSYETPPEIDRGAARDALNRRHGFTGDEFIVLTAFDSFSFTQRKNPVAAIKAFQQAFPDVPEARLLLKTQNRNVVQDPVHHRNWQQVDAFASQDHRISIIDETLLYDDLLKLKAASDCYMSLHRSEGWGFGMIEAMNLRVPVVCTGYSGNLEFCSEETSWLVGYKEELLGEGDYIFVRKGQKWAEPDVENAARHLRSVYADVAARERKVAAAYNSIRRNFSTAAIAKRYGKRLQEILASLGPDQNQ
jgi:glycosyltransferase involved in cell wall biosynthesis